MGSKKKISPSQPVSEIGGVSSSSPASSSSNTSSSGSTPVIPEPAYEPAVNEANPIELGSVETSAQRINPLMGNDLQSKIPIARQNELVQEVNSESAEKSRNLKNILNSKGDRTVLPYAGMTGEEIERMNPRDVVKAERLIEEESRGNYDALNDSLSLSQSIKNSANNSWVQLQKNIPQLQLLSTDVWEKTLGKELAQDFYKWDGRDINQVRIDAYRQLEDLDAELKQTKGNLSDNLKYMNGSGLVANLADAVFNLGSTALPAYVTGGAATVTSMTGQSIADYNKAKAKSTGKTVEQLYADGDAEIGVPLLIGGIATSLEFIGLKGAEKAMLGKLGKGSIAKKAALLGFETNKEGLTEWLQVGLDTANKSLAEGDNVSDVASKAIDSMFSKDGLNSYLMGTLGSLGAAGLGKVSRFATKPSTVEAINTSVGEIQQLESDLNNPNVSPQAKQVIQEQVVKKIEDISTALDKDIEESDRYTPKNKIKIDELSKRSEALSSVVNDENVSEVAKATAQTELDAVTKEIESIKPEIKPVETDAVKSWKNLIDNNINEETENIKEDTSATKIGRFIDRLLGTMPDGSRLLDLKSQRKLLDKDPIKFFENQKADLNERIKENPELADDYRRWIKDADYAIDEINKIRTESKFLDSVKPTEQSTTSKETEVVADAIKPTEKEPFSLGENKIFFHASGTKRNGRLRGSNAPQFGTGVYFSTSKDLVTNEFGEHLTEAELTINKPVYTNTKEWYEVEKEAIKLADEEYGKKNGLKLPEDETYFRYDPDNSSELAEISSHHISDAAKKLGYDAIIDKDSSTYDNEIVVLDEGKIIYPEDKLKSKPIQNEEIQQPLSESKNVEETSTSSPEETVDTVREEGVKKAHAIKEIEKGVLNWDGDRFSPRVVLGIEWTDIRKGREDLLAGKETAASRRLVDALDKAKASGGYDYIQGSGKITSKSFVALDAKAPEFTKEDLDYVSKNEKALAEEYDQWFEKLTPEEQAEEINSIENGSEKINTSAKSEENVSDQKDTEINPESTTEKGKINSEVKKPDWQIEVPKSDLRAYQQGYTVNQVRNIESALEPRKNFKNRSRMEDAIRSKEITFDEATSVIESAGIKVPENILKLKPSPQRSVSEIENDQKTLMARYQDALKEAGLYELAKENKAPEKELNEIKVRFSKEAEALKAEKSSLNNEVVDIKKPEELSAADKIRKMKVGKGKAFESILGIPIAIYDGALETVATAIEAGKSIKDAIKAAVAYFKEKSEVKDEVAIEKELRRVLEEGGLLIKGTDEANPVPDVINEIEDSPDFIADENIAEFKKRLGKVLDNAKAQTVIKTGVGRSDLAMNAIKLVSEIKDRKSMLDAARSVKKLFNDVVANTYRSQIEQAKAGLKTRIKSSALAKVDVIKKFIGINEKGLDVKDLEEYNELVRQLNEQYNSKIEGVVADSDLQKFVDKIADKKAKEIEAEQLGEVAEEESDVETSKSEEKSGRRKQLEAVVAINRKELQKGGYSEKHKVVAQALNRIDVSKLSNSDMVKLNLALINLSVNDRLVGHEKVFKDYVGQQGLEKVLPLESKVKGILESELAAATRSLDVNSKIIFKGIKDATEFQSEAGIAGISNANSQVKNIDMKTIDRDYQALIKGLNFADYNTAANRFLRALYSNSTQFSSIDGQAKDFARFKSLIKQSAEKLVGSKNIIEQKEGKLRMEQYEKYLEPHENREDFEAAFKTEQPQNVKIVDFFRKKFNDKFPELQTNSQIYGGRNLKAENNYLPIKYKRYSGTETEQEKQLNDIVEPVYDFDPETGDISERQSSTTIERQNVTKIKDTDRIMDMDFDRYIFDKYREMNYDIRTLKFRHQYNAIRSQEGFKNVVGGPENSKALTKGVRNMVKRQMGGTFDNDVLNNAVRATRIVTGKAVRQALFGVMQPFKQYPSVAIRTAINLNTDIGLFFKGIAIGKDNPIFDNFGVGLRSTTRGGTQTETELGRIYKSDFSSSPSKLAHAINRIGQATADALSKPLTFSDDAIAKHSWLAYYMKHVRDNGGDISKINWDNEHLNPDQKAGAYADLMVSTTQNTNDNAKQADLLAERKYAIGRDLIAPFVSFARNSQANMEADLRTFSGGTAAEKRAAAVGILSTVSEQAAFNTIKAIIAATLIKQGANYVRHLFGDDEEGSESQEGMASKIAKNTTSDILFSGMGSFANYWAIKGVNQANKAATGQDKDLFFQYDPGKFGEPDFAAAGLFGTLPQSIYNASQKADYLDGTLTDTYTNKGKEFKASVELSAQDRRMVSTLFFLDALSIAGLSDAEISRINQTMFRDIKKRTAPVKRFQIEGVNKKAGAMKEKL